MSAQEIYRQVHDLYILLDDSDHLLFAAIHLTIPQFNVLRLLNPQESTRLTELTQRLLYAKSTITKVIDQLEELQYVYRLHDEHDRRVHRILLTPEGEVKRTEAISLHTRSLEKRLSTLTAEQQAHLHTLLHQWHNGLQRHLGQVAEEL